MRILITGAGGMLGAALAERLTAVHDVIALPKAALDVTHAVAVQQTISDCQPDLVCHLAAWTDVDGCERDPARAFLINATATANVAAACCASGARLLYTSTIAVFSGGQALPYDETAVPQPANVHGQSKLSGESFARAVPNHTIVRLGWLFGGGERDHKFVQLIRRQALKRQRIAVVADHHGSPTYVVDLADGLARLIDEERFGLFHLVNEGSPASRLQVAEQVVAATQPTVVVETVSATHFPGSAPRPRMEAATSLVTAGWLRPWSAALDDYLQSL